VVDERYTDRTFLVSFVAYVPLVKSVSLNTACMKAGMKQSSSYSKLIQDRC
jgi:hypothetical protein